jgi:thiol:disulfide interchange protein DsbD
LSFLGVWEIPIPGFVGGRTAGEFAQKEGAVGAASKGVLTTVLATPCIGPFMGPAIAWAVAQPAHITFATFGSVGLGMATPYLLIGAFPRLVRFLPKPGAWMETFKQIMGFVLLATVVFVLSFISWTAVLPTVALMIGLWAACWWIGRTPITADRGTKLRAWCGAATFAMLAGLVSFTWLESYMEGHFELYLNSAIDKRLAEAQRGGPAKPAETADAAELPWQPYTRARFEQLVNSQRTVMVDFTASWCLSCQVNSRIALNTVETRDLVMANRVETLLADKSNPAPEVDELLDLLGNRTKSIPFLAIFPAGRPNEPILLDGPIFQKHVLKALREAGASKTPAESSTAMGP